MPASMHGQTPPRTPRPTYAPEGTTLLGSAGHGDDSNNYYDFSTTYVSPP